MNQSCRVCGEVAAGYHFGAFTCEGCKSFFGRTYNNRSSIGDCKNNNQCIINKKNRTSCKSCRLKKCFSVGMSKSGSRYGRRSNWFKIHCLLQDQGNIMQQQHSPQQQQAAELAAVQQHQNQHHHQLQQPQHSLDTNNTTTTNTSTTTLGHHHHHHSPVQFQLQQQQLQHQHNNTNNNTDSNTNTNNINHLAQLARSLQQQNPQDLSQATVVAAAAAAANQPAGQLVGGPGGDLDSSGMAASLYANALAQYIAYCYLVSQSPAQ